MTRSEKYQSIHRECRKDSLDMILDELRKVTDELHQLSEVLLKETRSHTLDDMFDNPMQQLDELFDLPRIYRGKL